MYCYCNNVIENEHMAAQTHISVASLSYTFAVTHIKIHTRTETNSPFARYTQSQNDITLLNTY